LGSYRTKPQNPAASQPRLHPHQARYPQQRILVVVADNYACLVPFLEDQDCYFLKTIISGRKATRDNLNQGESDAKG
jgi:hypothetical protein